MGMTNKLKVGIVGFGSMGSTHLDIYSKINEVEVIAIADKIQSRLDGSSKAEGNISGQAEGGITGLNAKKYLDGMDLINNPDIDIVDICVGTNLHYKFLEAALAKGKHVLIEKPLARNYDEAKKIIQLAENSPCYVMSAMCLRYWPAWVFLKEAIESNVYGKCYSLNFKRQTSFPGGAFYSDHNQCGGALLDLHVHDTDFVNYCLGLPEAVFSQGYKGPSGGIDHIVTNYIFNQSGLSPLVSSEGSWTMQEGYGFNMSYTANFENGTLSYLLEEHETLKLFRNGYEPESIHLKEGMGYEFEIRKFIEEILSGKATNLDLLRQAAETVAIIEAEKTSIETCSLVSINI